MKRVVASLLIVASFLAMAPVADARGCNGSGNGFFARLRARVANRRQPVNPVDPPAAVYAAVNYRAANCTCVNCQCGPQQQVAVAPVATPHVSGGQCFIDPTTGQQICPNRR